jgi:hypothetical protein
MHGLIALIRADEQLSCFVPDVLFLHSSPVDCLHSFVNLKLFESLASEEGQLEKTTQESQEVCAQILVY